jgi:hypothetical protein
LQRIFKQRSDKILAVTDSFTSLESLLDYFVFCEFLTFCAENVSCKFFEFVVNFNAGM